MPACRAGPTLTPPTCGGLAAESRSRSRRMSRSSRSPGASFATAAAFFASRASVRITSCRSRATATNRRARRCPQRELVGAEVTDDRRRALCWGQTDHHVQRSRSPLTTRSAFSSRSLRRRVALLFGHPALPLRACLVAVAPEPASQSQLGRRLDPDRVRQERTEGRTGRGDAFQDDEVGRPNLRPAAVVASPGRALEPRDAIPGQRDEKAFDQLRPPVDRVVPAREIVGVRDLGPTERRGQMRGEAALAGAAEPVDRNHPRLHPVGRAPRAHTVADRAEHRGQRLVFGGHPRDCSAR